MTNDKFDVVLLCGGKGSRLASVTEDKLPKSLYRVNSKELIRYSIDSLDLTSVNRVIFAVGYQSDMLCQWIDRQQFPFETVISEQIGEGVVAAVKSSSSHISTARVIVCNTDEIRHGFSMSSFIDRCREVVGESEAAMATTKANNLFRHRIVMCNEDGLVMSTSLKDELYKQSVELEGMINIGFLMLPKMAIVAVDERYGNDWSSIIDPLVEQRRMYSVFNPGVAYFNVGTPQELIEANDHFTSLML